MSRNDFGLKFGETSVDSGLSQMQLIGINASNSYNSLHLRSAVGTGIVIDTSNNVGIGTDTPATKFEVESTTNGEVARFVSSAGNPGGVTGSAYLGLDSFSGTTNPACLIGVLEESVASFRHDFQILLKSASATDNSPTERFRIDGGTGNVLVGKSTDDDNTTGVRLNGTGILSASRAVNVAGIFNRTGNTGNLVLFRQQDTQVGSISVTSSATAYNTTGSDERLKKNITDWDEKVLDKFKDLQPKIFNYKTEKDGEKKTKGYIAQNEIDKFPEAYPLVEDEKSGEKRYWFNPSGMNVYLMKAIQELKEEIDELKKEI